VLDVAQLDDGRLYISMEFLEGCSLEAFIRGQGPLGIGDALQIVVPACDGLQAAHDAGIIHRDLKPANLFLVNTPENPRFVKLLDFGIAKVTRKDLAGNVETGSHVVLGTPGYMSFEEARGSAGVDQRSDVYAMGVIAYQMLTGCLPYSAVSIGDLVAQQLGSGPPSPEALRPDLPQGWVDTILSALATEPAVRPASARAFALSLIDATPNGTAIARAVSPRFFVHADANDRTVQDATALPAAPVVAGATVALKPQSTISRSSGQQYPGELARTRRRWPFAVASAALLAAIGIAAGLVARSTGQGASSTDAVDLASSLPDAAVPAVSASEPPHGQPPDAAVPATTVLHVQTAPRGATVRHGGAVDGPTPVDLELVTGTKVELTVELSGHQSESRQVTAAPGLPPLLLSVKRRHNERPHHHAHSKSGAGEREESSPKKTPGAEPLQHFDPDAPGG